MCKQYAYIYYLVLGNELVRDSTLQMAKDDDDDHDMRGDIEIPGLLYRHCVSPLTVRDRPLVFSKISLRVDCFL